MMGHYLVHEMRGKQRGASRLVFQQDLPRLPTFEWIHAYSMQVNSSIDIPHETYQT